jgi:membrane-bound lytic murein transglycosylase D
MKFFLVGIIAIFSYKTVFGEKDSLIDNRKYDDRVNYFDSLLKSFYLSHPYEIYFNDETLKGDTFNIDYPDTVYLDRLSRIPAVVPLPYNEIVKRFIEVYTVKNRKKSEAILGLTEIYFPIIEPILESYGLPIELKYLAVIESALNPNAVSRAGATGLWQFMYGTGKLYKLEINSLVDERRDIVKSTIAAAQYLKDLYSVFNDWLIVIAAYNCGPGNVNKAIYRTGGKKDYWEIYYRLPRETRGYIPAYIAATYFCNYYKYHNLYPNKPNINFITDTIIVNDILHFEQVSQVLGISIDELRLLNPQYRRDIIPINHKNYALRLPIEYIGPFIEKEEEIYNYKDSLYFNPEILKAKPVYHSHYKAVQPAGTKAVYYTVKAGDNLGYISQWFNVSVNDLRYWNNINRNLIRAGQKLIIYVPKNKASYYQQINTMSFEQKQKLAG